MALILGEEKKAKPAPIHTRLARIRINGVLDFKNMKKVSPNAVMAIPAVAGMRGSMRSDRRPASGEKSAMTVGWAINTVPVAWGGNPFRYCKYKLSKKVRAKVAA